MKVGKPQSKRVPVRLRHKIQKASANKQRKARKDAKKNPQWRSRLKKDPGIPNLFPYKDKPPAPKAKPLPKSVLADPIKPVTRLITKLSTTQTGIQQLLDYYKLPPLVTAGSDTTTRFLIDVARKKGRLGPGGVPSLNGAALAVLGDLNEGRLKLDLSAQPERKVGDVVVVQKLGEAFKIEGLFGDEEPPAAGGEMEVEA
ncbi:GTPase grn1 [Pseudocercospora fuligena]|uniref:GTPase grn1 n=1 Tax=Pseudocercospora fuligena TaxID=685502 RepID=A0A8H6RMW3_9PEZI|nr:GTPase grn1 [Pseudocercospora fuligena]